MRLEANSGATLDVGAQEEPYCAHVDGVKGFRPYLELFVVGGDTWWILVSGDETPFHLDYRLIPAAKPANDDFHDAQLLPEQAGWLRVSNAGASREVGEPLHAGRAGGRSLWFRWTARANGRAVFSTIPSDSVPGEVDTLLAVYTGASVDTLTRVAWNDDASRDGSSRVEFNARAGRTYHIAVDGRNGAEGSLWRDHPGYERDIELTWNAEPGPPNDDFGDAIDLNADPSAGVGWTRGASREPGEPNHTRGPGSASVWFRWKAPRTGSASVSLFQIGYRTLRGRLFVYTGRNVADLTEVPSTFDPTGVPSVRWQARAGTSYHIALDPGLDRTGAFIARVSQASALVNDDLADAVRLEGAIGTWEDGTDDGATSEPGEPAHAGLTAEASVWFTWTAPATGPVSFDTVGTGRAPRLAAYQGGSLASLVEVASNPAWTYKWSKITFTAVTGRTYKIAFDQGRGQTGFGVHLNWLMAGDRDSTPPTASIVSPPAGIDVSGRLSLVLEAADDVAIRWVSPNPTMAWTGWPDHEPPYEFELDTTLFADGMGYELGAVAVDMGGNASRVEPRRINIENSTPLAWADAPDGAVRSTSAVVRAVADASDVPSARLCSLDGAPYVDCSEDGLRYDGLAEGDHVLRTHVVDRVGKRSIVPGTAVWTVDTRPVAPSASPADATPPVASAPFTRLVTRVRAGARTIPVRVALDASDEAGSIVGYELDRRSGAGAWRRVWRGRTNAVTQVLPLRSIQRFRVRATDRSGNRGAWAQAEPLHVVALEETRGSTSRFWRRVRRASALHGRLKHSSTRGAWMQVPFVGSEIGLVSSTGPNRGRAQVSADGRIVGTVDLYSARYRSRRVVFRHAFESAGRHVIKVRVLGTKNGRSSGKRVDVDGFLVLG